MGPLGDHPGRAGLRVGPTLPPKSNTQESRKENDKKVRIRAACPSCRFPNQSHIADDKFPGNLHQILYRWTVNRLLARHGIDLQLAKSGEDVGRLVHVPADGREDLVAAAVGRPSSDGNKVRHAVTMFRSRTADSEAKRSACIALAGVLESRRPLIKAELLSKDEGALFRIANEFAIRHQDAKQHPDYDEAYLDWLYWWYLATVELTDRLIARSSNGS